MEKILDKINNYMREQNVREKDLYKSEEELLGSILEIIEKENLKKINSNIIPFPIKISENSVDQNDYD